MLKEIRIAEEKNIVVHGRTVGNRNPVTLLWSGSSVEMCVKCSELYVELEGPYRDMENWIAIEVNGEIVARQMVRKEREWVCVFRSKLAEKATRVRIIKSVQAMEGDPEHCLKLYAVKLDGEILPVPEYGRRIEYIGDSITSAEGTIGAKSEEEWISMFFSHERSYPYMVSKALEADYRIISQSGWGLFASYDNRRDHVLPLHYENICSLVPPEHFKEQGFYEKNDFAAWQPDVICVNLGTNDDGAFHNPPYTDPESGSSYKLRMIDENTYLQEDLKLVSDAAENFLRMLRRCNPDAYILWCYGILGTPLLPALQAGMDAYKKESGDEKAEILILPAITEETVGARQHPGEAAHRLAAETIIHRIKELF